MRWREVRQVLLPTMTLRNVLVIILRLWGTRVVLIVEEVVVNLVPVIGRKRSGPERARAGEVAFTLVGKQQGEVLSLAFFL